MRFQLFLSKAGRISIRIKLTVKKFKDQGILRKIPKFGDSTRIFSFVKIKQKDGSWSKTYPVIVDTGAHTSVIPMSKWMFSDIKLLADHEMTGIVPKKECYLPVKIGKMKIVICDQSGNFTKEYA